MARSNYTEISREALLYNATAITRAVSTPVIGVVKCDGYGVTISEAAAAWDTAGAFMLAVSRPEEALTLRETGYSKDILLMTPVVKEETLLKLRENNVIFSVSSLENAQFYSSHSGTHPIRVHIAVDTGMGRFGIPWTKLDQIRAVYALTGLHFEGIFSHFARAFEKKYHYTHQQLDRFLQITNALQAEGMPLGMRHIANTNAALRFPETRLDAVRIGIGLIGISRADLKLVSVKTNYAEVVECKHFNPGDRIGYGRHCVIKKPTKAIIVALGDRDGFGQITVPERLRLRNFASYLYQIVKRWRRPPCVTYQGKRMQMLGQVGREYTFFDATDSDIQPGDRVLWDGNPMQTRTPRIFV